MKPWLLLILSFGSSCTSSALPPPPTGDASTDLASVVDAAAPTDAAAPVDAPGPEDNTGASAALSLDYTGVDCAAVELAAANGGGIRQNEICDRGRGAPSRFASVRDCAASYSPAASLLARVADDGAYMNPTRHPYRGEPCSRFTTLYPVEQVAHALWCLRRAGRCNDDGSVR